MAKEEKELGGRLAKAGWAEERELENARYLLRFPN